MEPLTFAAIAVGTGIGTKILEKAGESIGENVIEKWEHVRSGLKRLLPNIASAIELAPQQPLDIGQAVLEVDSAAKANPEFARAVRELAEAAKADPNPELARQIQEVQKVVDTLKAQQPAINNPNFTNRQDKSLFIQGTVQNSPINIT